MIWPCPELFPPERWTKPQTAWEPQRWAEPSCCCPARAGARTCLGIWDPPGASGFRGALGGTEPWHSVSPGRGRGRSRRQRESRYPHFTRGDGEAEAGGACRSAWRSRAGADPGLLPPAPAVPSTFTRPGPGPGPPALAPHALFCGLQLPRCTRRRGHASPLPPRWATRAAALGQWGRGGAGHVPLFGAFVSSWSVKR